MIVKRLKSLLPEMTGSQWALVLRLVAFGLFIIIGLIVALILIKSGQRYAFEITAKHDLLNFVKIEQAYYAEYGEHSAEPGDIISGVPEITSTFSLKNFSPSSGVIIRILSQDPFIVTSSHEKTGKNFEYNFNFGLITEKRTGDSDGEEKISEEKGELSYQERDTDPDDSN
jgi:hypothetical protein